MNIDQIGDAVHVAAQLGRLDFISALLGIIALFGVIGAFPLFWFLRRKAAEEARLAIEQHLSSMSEEIEGKAIKRLEELLPDLIKDYGNFAKDAISNDMADMIAAAQSETQDVDD